MFEIIIVIIIILTLAILEAIGCAKRCCPEFKTPLRPTSLLKQPKIEGD